MCIPTRGKGGEEKGSKLWQSLRKCCLYSPNNNFKKKREINHKQTTNHQTSNNSKTKPNTEKAKG